MDHASEHVEVTFHDSVSVGDIASRYLHFVTEKDPQWKTAMDVKARIGQELEPDALSQTATSSWIQHIVDHSEHQDFALVMQVFGIIDDAKVWAAVKAGERLVAELEVGVVIIMLMHFLLPWSTRNINPTHTFV